MGNRDNKRSLRQKLQDMMSTPKGQTVLNYAYNWGASIVLMGALFKLIHLPGANIALCVGMGTEVLIFFISAFDLSGVKRGPEPDIMPRDNSFFDSVPMNASTECNLTTGVCNPNAEQVASQQQVYPNNGGQPFAQPMQPAMSQVQTPQHQHVHAMQHNGYVQQPYIQPVSQPVQTSQPVTPEMEQATAEYMIQLKAMTSMLARCTEQTQNIAQDSEQMQALAKNLAGINAIYEMQLRSASTQITTIDQVHEQTRRMARQIEELNEVYARMLHAMTSK